MFLLTLLLLISFPALCCSYAIVAHKYSMRAKDGALDSAAHLRVLALFCCQALYPRSHNDEHLKKLFVCLFVFLNIFIEV